MKRHVLSTRLWHWINLVAVSVLFMSGLNISNAHPHLYWGDYGFDPDDAWLHVIRFPGYVTIPNYYSLAAARDWHNIAAWLFAVALLAMWVNMLVSRRFAREIRTSPREWKPSHLANDIRGHLRGNYEAHEGKYNTLQKIAYGSVYGVFLPMMVFTGLAISPGIEPAAPWLVDILGGRQSARSLHFLFAWGLFGFVVVHVVMVIAAGASKQIWSMIDGGEEETEVPHD